MINSLDVYAFCHEEAFVSQGESGEPEALSTMDDSSQSSTVFEDASEEVLAEGAEGAQDGGCPESVPVDDGQFGV